MKHFISNQKGISLVELIAALAIVSLVSILIMTTMGIGFKYSVAESNKTSTQQEANLIVQKLLNKHRLGECYKLTVEQDAQTGNNVLFYNQVTCRTGSTPNPEPIVLKEALSSSQYNITSLTPYVNPKKNDVIFKATLKYGSKASYEINTVLSRYKTN